MRILVLVKSLGLGDAVKEDPLALKKIIIARDQKLLHCHGDQGEDLLPLSVTKRGEEARAGATERFWRGEKDLGTTWTRGSWGSQHGTYTILKNLVDKQAWADGTPTRKKESQCAVPSFFAFRLRKCTSKRHGKLKKGGQ